YLARGNLGRMRESIRERSLLMAIAPDLVVPLPVLVPTRGHGPESRLAMQAALALNDLASAAGNRRLDPAHRIPRGRVLSRAEAARLFPPLAARQLTGGALWHDARIRSPERLTLSLVQSAVERGAAAANYVEATRILSRGGDVSGVEAVDRRTGASLTLAARAVVVAAGQWTESLVSGAARRPEGTPPRQALALNLMIGRPLVSTAVGVRALSGAEADPVIGGRRYIFLAPQEGCTLAGTWYGIDTGTDPAAIATAGAERLRVELNEACPGLDLAPADVARVQVGWMPLRAGLEPGRPSALADRVRFTDHGAQGTRHLFSLEGVKYTTARGVAARAVDRIVGDLGVRASPCRTDVTPLIGAHYVAADDPRLADRIREAVRDEMAVTLADIVFRRTMLGEPPGPGRQAVEEAATVAGEALGWDARTRLAEVEEVMRLAAGPLAERGMVPA
ncbi:MAG TPA: FAD-dependent oxidoreductase, partial [Gemmatimonadales bacterium]|nr:FAD-dependent oxidoreductase [Gemmatimonadales bacterium]